MAVYTLLFLAVYVLAPIAILLVFLFWQPRHALWSVPISTVPFLLVYWRDFLYYESRRLALLFLAVQATVTAILALVIRIAAKRRQWPSPSRTPFYTL